ncbi:hypothetical protein CLV30_12230 [Haloactinopolyspora alba]|uniref:Small secreted protein n=1 Tax=Haloactinopolyspora alba TaxID=648780 RepID=A0A2P8DK21_9ACTN|nr:hypothetical protein [Haloactinopolyspora alba]PSK97538.1 hypothetical protein CLV30_12230 [Haloactinopolyspora alba]
MTRITQTAFSLLGASALAISLTACGDSEGGGETTAGSDGGGYCDELKSVNEEFANAGSAMTNPDQLSGMVDSFQGIADVAPEEVKADWEALVGGLETLSEIDMSDPEAMQDPKVKEKLQGLGDLQTNSDNISTHAKDECDIDLGGSGATATPGS